MREGSRAGGIFGNLRESTTEILGFISGRVGWSEVTGFEVRGRGARVRFGNIEGVGVLECQWVRSQVRKILLPQGTSIYPQSNRPKLGTPLES